jgi:steroid 5-alpha reductase family enzyme
MINQFFNLFLLIFVSQVLFFLVANAFKTDKLTDLAYGITFVIVINLLFWKSQQELFFILPTLLVSLWGIRLASYLFIRILKIKKDQRFNQIRQNFWSFLQFWLLQALSIFAISLSFILSFSLADTIKTNVNAWQIIFFILALIALGIETIADWQKYQFKNNAKNKGKFIQSGLWKHSRHPNYLGEILFWWCLFFYFLPSLGNWTLLALVSPIYITVLIRFVSGVPLLEKNYAERYGKEWLNYKKKTRII